MKQGANIIPIKYFGYLQGHKVIFKDKKKQMKFPRTHGHFYTALTESESLNNAIKELNALLGDTNSYYITYLLVKLNDSLFLEILDDNPKAYS